MGRIGLCGWAVLKGCPVKKPGGALARIELWLHYPLMVQLGEATLDAGQATKTEGLIVTVSMTEHKPNKCAYEKVINDYTFPPTTYPLRFPLHFE